MIILVLMWKELSKSQNHKIVMNQKIGFFF